MHAASRYRRFGKPCGDATSIATPHCQALINIDHIPRELMAGLANVLDSYLVNPAWGLQLLPQGSRIGLEAKSWCRFIGDRNRRRHRKSANT
jgi:hypothetical protein